MPSLLGDYDQTPEAWPDEVGRFWKQARRALARDDLDAGSVMARSALQAALRQVTAAGNSLYAEIDDLAQCGLLPPIMKDWAHELRLLGNSSAHPEIGAAAPSRKDVSDVVEFLEYLMSYLFSLPRRIEEYRERSR